MRAIHTYSAEGTVDEEDSARARASSVSASVTRRRLLPLGAPRLE